MCSRSGARCSRVDDAQEGQQTDGGHGTPLTSHAIRVPNDVLAPKVSSDVQLSAGQIVEPRVERRRQGRQHAVSIAPNLHTHSPCLQRPAVVSRRRRPGWQQRRGPQCEQAARGVVGVRGRTGVAGTTMTWCRRWHPTNAVKACVTVRRRCRHVKQAQQVVAGGCRRRS
jgi:hypothetical protein